MNQITTTMKRHCRKPDTLNKQRGLAAVEFCLIAPVLAVIVILMLNSSKSLLLHEQRIIAARNSAYLTETYFRSNHTTDSSISTFLRNEQCDGQKCYPTRVDYLLSRFDNGMRQLEQFDSVLEQADTAINDINGVLQTVGADTLDGVPIVLPKDLVSRVFDKKVINYSERTSANSMDSRLKETIREPDTEVALELASAYTGIQLHRTVGVAVSDYLSPLGRFDRRGVVMRQYHLADFADALDIPTEPRLKNGYKRQMWNKLKPDRFYQNTFPSLRRHPGRNQSRTIGADSIFNSNQTELENQNNRNQQEIELQQEELRRQVEEERRQQRCANADPENLPEECL